MPTHVERCFFIGPSPGLSSSSPLRLCFDSRRLGSHDGSTGRTAAATRAYLLQTKPDELSTKHEVRSPSYFPP